jgi:hypothetical protein
MRARSGGLGVTQPMTDEEAMSEVDPAVRRPTARQRYAEFERELTHLINRLSLENDSDTPDFILAGLLVNTLIEYNHVIHARRKFGSVGGDPE